MNCKGTCNSSNHREDGLIACKRIVFVSRKYIINDTPMPLKRARVTNKRVYDSQKQVKLMIGLGLRNQHLEEKPYDGVLHFDVDFFFKLPALRSKKNILTDQLYHNYKPDLSNLLKMIEDICVDSNIIRDDCLISSVYCRKLYALEGEPRTEFIITKIK